MADLNRLPDTPQLPDSIATQMLGLKFSDAPGKAFMIAKDVILAADESFEFLHDKLKIFVPRTVVQVQARYPSAASPSKRHFLGLGVRGG